MIEKIVKRDGQVVPFRKEKIAFAVFRAAVAVGGRDRAVADSIADEVVRLLERRNVSGSYPTVEEVQDAVEKILIERGHARTAKAYILYRYEHALKRAGRESLTYSSENIPYRKLWEALSWAVDHACVRTSDLSGIVLGGRYQELIDAAETYYRTEVESAAQKIVERLDDVKVVIIAGPSSSGKTTTTKKIAETLERHDRRLVPLNVDNYFFDLASHPKDIYGDYDFETPQALDLELLSSHLAQILEGREVEIPFYNFKTGTREGSAGTIRLGERDILLIDSLHGLYEAMTEGISPERIFKVYIETLAQLKDSSGAYVRWADIRMLRRMVRDLQFRSYSPRQTLLHWHFVRRAELRYIISRLRHANAIINSYIPYELPIFKHRLGGMFPRFVEELTGTEDHPDAFERAVRIMRLFDEIPEWTDESVVPRDSLMREFIGGSSYSY